MSTNSRSSWRASKSLNRGLHGNRRSLAAPRDLDFEDGFSFALRVAFLDYILQPRKKRKEYVSAPKAPSKSQTSNFHSNMMDITKSSSTKLPHNFQKYMDKRMQGVMTGQEKMAGYNDAALKRSFAEAYTALTDQDVRKSLDKDRNIELYLLKFFSSATKAQQRGKAPDDDSWKMLPDRHVAMFIRLMISVIRELGGDQKRPDLMKGLTSLEKKILTNDQDLSLDTGGQEGQHKFIEVEIPLSYNIQDMPMVQIVAKVFGRSQSEVQGNIDSSMAYWTEEAAMKDLKLYQNRLTSNTTGALRRQDFEADAAYEEWKKAETHQLGQLMHEVLMVRPELAKLTTGAHEKPLPTRPKSTYDESYGDLSRMIMNGGADPHFGFEPSGNRSSFSAEGASSIRTVPDESDYIYIPPYPREYYKFVLKNALSYDQLNPDEPGTEVILSKQSNELLTELAMRWRIPQFSRHIIYLEVAAHKYLDLEITTTDLYTIFDIVKETKPPEPKKPPLIQLHNQALDEIDRQRWTQQDSLTYRQTLDQLHRGLLRELHENASQCYEPKAASVGPSLMFIMNHIRSDPEFTWPDQDAEDFRNSLTESLTIKAGEAYRDYLNSNVPPSQGEWDFSHVVNLGKAVTALCEKIRKRYKKNPEIMGVSPFRVLVAKVFPSFEGDAPYLIKNIIDLAKERGLEVNLQDGFDLYKELVAIRKIHEESLKEQQFAFNIEELLEEFVWRWIKGAEARMTDFVEEAIKQDQFKPRTQNPDGTFTDVDRHSHSVIDMFQLFNQTVDQVVQLNWDSDIHHAQFMTSLAKAFTAGVGRYCEVLEQMFSREMDRPTKQEQEASGKTTQERFMQYARDAMSTKEKVEPFQFYPESFIKLNNIEYAMQALDKLEKSINVDACAEVLERSEKQNKTKERKIVKNVFTIKIVEAEDIKACDPTGLSDPYVVLCDEYQKRLAKTRIIMKNLNPRWDESVDITVSGPLNIIATLWDYDTFGDHDFVGRTSLKLDPLHFGDYLPREYWLDLDTQGRLLIKVSMEGERDDIQFHFGKAFRHLKRTERDMVRKISDKLNTHINATLSRETLRSLLSRGIASSVAVLWQKRTSKPPALTQEDIVNALQSLFTYFDENFAIMKQTLTDATMAAVMTRLWKEVLMAVEHLLVPPLSEKPSLQKPLTQAELDVVYRWLQLLFDFFNAKDDHGEVLGVPADVLKSPKWHELASLNFFYFDTTENLMRTSERIAAATAQRAQQLMQSAPTNNRLSAPAAFSGALAPPVSPFASMGTIRRGKSVMMSRNLGTMRRIKEEKRKEAQADPSDDMILRILRMRPEATGYLKDRHRQKERMVAHQAAALIVKQSVNQGWSQGPPPFGGGQFGKNNLPRR